MKPNPEERYDESQLVEVQKYCRVCKTPFLGQFWRKPAEEAIAAGNKILGICPSCDGDLEAKIAERNEEMRRNEAKSLAPELEFPNLDPELARDHGFVEDEEDDYWKGARR